MMLRTALLLLFAAAVCACGCTQPGVTAGGEQTAWNLTLAGDGEEVFTLTEVRALPAVEGYGHGVSTVGIVFGPDRYRGVLLADLLERVGGTGQDDLVYVSAEDGYLWVLDAEQLAGEGFFTFDEDLKEIPPPPLRVILAYERDGAPLPYDDGGPLRLVVVSDDPGVITEASSWVKWVDRVEVHRR